MIEYIDMRRNAVILRLSNVRSMGYGVEAKLTGRQRLFGRNDALEPRDRAIRVNQGLELVGCIVSTNSRLVPNLDNIATNGRSVCSSGPQNNAVEGDTVFARYGDAHLALTGREVWRGVQNLDIDEPHRDRQFDLAKVLYCPSFRNYTASEGENVGPLWRNSHY